MSVCDIVELKQPLQYEKESYVRMDSFQLPIEYLDNKREVSDVIVDDLELLHDKNKDEKNDEGLYNIVFDINGMNKKVRRNIKTKWAKFYTSDSKFLTESQEIYENVGFTKTLDASGSDSVIELLDNISNAQNFEDSFLYVNNIYCSEKLNTNETFMLLYSLFLIFAPIMTVMSPLMVLILPFLILKLQKIKISLGTYVTLLKRMLQHLPVGKLLSMDVKNLNSILYALFSSGMYVFQIYQNTHQCITLKKKTLEMVNKLILVRNYLVDSLPNMKEMHLLSCGKKSYDKFSEKLQRQIEETNEYVDRLMLVTNSRIEILNNIGVIRCLFYDLYKNNRRSGLIGWVSEFNGYVDCIRGLKKKIGAGMNKAEYRDKSTYMKSMYYPVVAGKSCVKNNVHLNKNEIITGVNASGKTTLIKSILLNVLLSQQVGFGYYKVGKMQLYDVLHCYLNIPDTSGRDSLFQAEARRCKTILDSVNNESNKRHLCIFDELYSGTNPYEATLSGYAYVKYLCKRKNIRFVLTTHYLEMSKELDTLKNIRNSNMHSYYEGDNICYTYKKKNGISKVYGGVEVLKKLNYPWQIVEDAKKLKNIRLIH